MCVIWEGSRSQNIKMASLQDDSSDSSIVASHNVHISKWYVTVQPACFLVGWFDSACWLKGLALLNFTYGQVIKDGRYFWLPKAFEFWRPFCLLLFKMGAQNVIKFDEFQHLVATLCRFLTLFTKKLDCFFIKVGRIHWNRVL